MASRLRAELVGQERVARFIRKTGAYDEKTGYIDPGEFQLRPQDVGELSAYLIDGLTAAQKWEAGDGVFKKSRCCAAAELIVEKIHQLPYSLKLMQDVPRKHVGIIGIPNDKAQALTIAQELARMAELKVRH